MEHSEHTVSLLTIQARKMNTDNFEDELKLDIHEAAGYSAWLHQILGDVDQGGFYIQYFDLGFFVSPNRIATGYIPSRLLQTVLTALDDCEDNPADGRFPLGAIQNLFGWHHTLQTVAETYLRTSGYYTSIEETFLDQVAFRSGIHIRDLFDNHSAFYEMVLDRGVSGPMVRFMHLLWILRGIAYRCDTDIHDYCIRQQIQTAHERMEVQNHFGA
jgi:hypothetical protein